MSGDGTVVDGKPGRRRITLTQQIFIGLIIGIAVGALFSRYWPARAVVFEPFSQLFLRLIRMILAPLIFCTLVAGMAGAGHLRSVGRMGVRAIIYFEVVTTLALAVGLAMGNIIQPGVGVKIATHGPLPDVAAHPQRWDEILLHLVPTSIIKALAENDVLQIVVFAMLFAVALTLTGERKRPVVALCESVSEAMFQLTNLVMRYAPIGVGAAIAWTVGTSGLGVLVDLAKLVGTLYLALAVFVLLVLVPVVLIMRLPLGRLVRTLREPAVIAFSTATSEAALPRAMEVVEAFGVPRRIVAFILPLGYSFNLDGSTLYLSLAALFIAQSANVHLSLGQQLTMMLTLMLTSKGVAGVPRASMVILAGTVASYGLPLERLGLIIAVDHLMDMARTTVNVVGNCVAAVVVAKWEGELDLEAGQRRAAAAETLPPIDTTLLEAGAVDAEVSRPRG